MYWPVGTGAVGTGAVGTGAVGTGVVKVHLGSLVLLLLIVSLVACLNLEYIIQTCNIYINQQYIHSKYVNINI